MDESIDFTGRIWAIVSAGSRRYIGKVVNFIVNDDVSDALVGDDVLTIEGIVLNPAYELNTITQPVQVAPGQVALRRETLVFPLDCCSHDARVNIIAPQEIIFAEDLHATDQKMYIEQVTRVRAQMQESRVQKLGLSTAPGGFNPNNFRGGPPFGS